MYFTPEYSDNMVFLNNDTLKNFSVATKYGIKCLDMGFYVWYVLRTVCVRHFADIIVWLSSFWGYFGLFAFIACLTNCFVAMNDIAPIYAVRHRWV